MPNDTLGQRLQSAMQAARIDKPVELARLTGTSLPTISNWLNDNVGPDYVKAVQLFKIADALKADPRELLLGERSAHGQVQVSLPSQVVTPENWIVAFQLVAEALDKKGLELPPEKRAQVTLLAYELLQEELPRAKVLRFVQTAAA